MFQNVKTDIIYYKTATDFEMEFNLCGCCRMRLLTDKSPDKKTLIQSLARAVSRSRVIIVTGNLFGDDGITSIVASAIGSELAIADNKTYGINGTDEINIIKGSTPLVTADGIFGGCIIESGPQTMILLSDSKNVRKQIMQTLIHPYIEELYTADLTEKVAQNNKPEVEEEILQDTDLIFEEVALQDVSELTDGGEDFITETETEEIPQEILFEESDELVTESEESDETEIIDVPEEIVAEQSELIFEEDDFSDENPAASFEEDGDIVLTNGMTFETDEQIFTTNVVEDEEIEMYGGESKAERRKEKKAYKGYQVESFDEDEDFIYEDFRRTNSFRSSPLNLPILIVSIILLVLLAVLAYCIFYIPANNGVSAQEYLKEIFGTLFRG